MILLQAGDERDLGEDLVDGVKHGLANRKKCTECNRNYECMPIGKGGICSNNLCVKRGSSCDCAPCPGGATPKPAAPAPAPASGNTGGSNTGGSNTGGGSKASDTGSGASKVFGSPQFYCVLIISVLIFNYVE